MKRFLASILIVVLLFGTFSCAKDEKNGPLKIVTTNFAAYDWTRNLIGDSFTDYELALIGGGVDLHSFSPSAADIMKIADADIFIYVGGESDKWARDVELKENAVAISLIDSLNSSTLVYNNGVADEHVWLSPYNAQILCKAIEKGIVTLRPDCQSKIADTLESYALQLLDLEGEYIELADGFKSPTVVVADRFPFSYIVRDSALAYYAVFDDCGTDAEASFEQTMKFSKLVDELAVKNVIVTESSDKKLANTIIENSQNKDCGIVVVDSMQSVTEDSNYIKISKSNLEILKNAIFEGDR